LGKLFNNSLNKKPIETAKKGIELKNYGHKPKTAQIPLHFSSWLNSPITCFSGEKYGNI
jgi:hypothetical protein